MRFEQRLSSCLEALAQGQSVEECLAQHPGHAEALEPLLRLAVSLQTQDKPRLSTQSFRAGRQALTSAAQAAQAKRFTNASPAHGAHRHLGSYQDPARQSTHQARGNRTNPHRGRQWFPRSRRPLHNGYHVPAGDIPGAARTQRSRADHRMSDWPTDRAPTQWRQRIVAVALALLLFLGMAAALRQVAVSIPGSPLYGIKTASERTQGMLMSAGGEGARWHAEQTVRRLHELSQLTAQTTAQAPTAALVTSLTHEIESHTQQALAGSTQFSSAEQQVFLEQWYEQLAAVEKEALRTNRANRTTVDLMQQVSAQILSAIAGLETGEDEAERDSTPAGDTAADDTTPAPRITASTTASTERPLDTPSTRTSDTTLVTTPTKDAKPTARAASLDIIQSPTPTRVLRATPVPTATTVPPRTRVLPLATSTATTTPLPVITQVMPIESQSNDSNQDRGSATENGDSNENPAQIDNDRNNGSEPADNPTDAPDPNTEAGDQLDGQQDRPEDGETDPATGEDEVQPDVTLAPWTPSPVAEETTVTSDVPLLPTVATPIPGPVSQPSVEAETTESGQPVTPTVTENAPSTVIPQATVEDPVISPPAGDSGEDNVQDGTSTPEQPRATAEPQATATTEQRPTRVRTRRPSATPTSAPETNSSVAAATAEPTDLLAP